LTKIDKSKIQDKNGKKWYNFQVSINDEKDQYENDGSVWENQTKEEREAKKPKNYLGNCKVSWTSGAKPQQPTQESKLSESTTDLLPF
jgi:hypothetical protein